MPRRQNLYPLTVGCRLTPADRAKLRALSTSLHRPPGEVLRLLIRAAEPSGAPEVLFRAVAEPVA